MDRPPQKHRLWRIRGRFAQSRTRDPLGKVRASVQIASIFHVPQVRKDCRRFRRGAGARRRRAVGPESRQRLDFMAFVESVPTERRPFWLRLQLDIAVPPSRAQCGAPTRRAGRGLRQTPWCRPANRDGPASWRARPRRCQPCTASRQAPRATMRPTATCFAARPSGRPIRAGRLARRPTPSTIPARACGCRRRSMRRPKPCAQGADPCLAIPLAPLRWRQPTALRQPARPAVPTTSAPAALCRRTRRSRARNRRRPRRPAN